MRYRPPIPPTDTNSFRTVVLVVDDESVIADTLVEILNRNGYTAIAAYDAEGALEIRAPDASGTTHHRCCAA